MNLNIDTGKGVPSPFPAPVQTATATQNTTPQAGVAAKTIQPPQAAAPVQNAQPVNTQAQSISTHANIFTNASTYHYLTGNGFMNDIAFFNTYKDRKTGFANMDLIQPLLPGLYGIGAPPFEWKNHVFVAVCKPAGVHGRIRSLFRAGTDKKRAGAKIPVTQVLHGIPRGRKPE